MPTQNQRPAELKPYGERADIVIDLFDLAQKQSK